MYCGAHITCACCWMSALHSPERYPLRLHIVRCAPPCVFGVAEATKGLPHVREYEQALILEGLQCLYKLCLSQPSLYADGYLPRQHELPRLSASPSLPRLQALPQHETS